MSRVGLAPIPVPSGVEVELAPGRIRVRGQKGELERSIPEEIRIERSDAELRVTRSSESREARARHGLVRSLVANMIHGVTEGYEKRLEIHGVGYRATKQGDAIELQVGYSHPVRKAPPPGISFEVPSATKINVRGIDKELVGRVAEEIRSIRRPEPYKAKGIRFEGEHVRRKGGKAAKAGV